jgi:hypothetical protein
MKTKMENGMLVRRLAGNIGQILDLDERDARMRVENGIAEFLPETELEDDSILERIGKIPEPAPVQVALPAVDQNTAPPGYSIVQDKTTNQNAFRAFTPTGKPTHYKPWPNRMAAICAAREHRALSPADRRAMEAQVAVDRAAHEAAQRGGVSEQQFADKIAGV